ncbi:hypothetical protein BCR44DRAFT_38018 [Catenaria anguillulae PL171]|uniref:Uncharacterized protein n=1 Tax=Catenaria anguillulae PL171 TaxID=765915 RepID=A0A1Y2HRC6_9FUNG|nr:hypothetical protein BCR44DRAFT_38018 [Catenaria anguillulae PL171]
MTLLAAQCKREGVFARVLWRALTFLCPIDADPPQTRVALLGLLIANANADNDYARAANLLTDHARQLASRVYLERGVYRASLLDLVSFGWDYTAFLQEHLARGYLYVNVSPGQVVATCMSHGIAWDRLTLKEVVTACALHLMAFMESKGIEWCKRDEMRTARATDDEVKVVSFLVRLVRARLNESKVATAGNINRDPKKARTRISGQAYFSFSQLLPHDCWIKLRHGIITVATIPPLVSTNPHTHARDPGLAYEFFLDTMLVLDAQFVYELIPYYDLVGTLRLWTRLDFRRFVRRRKRLPLVLGALRDEAEAGNVEKVAYIIGGLPDTFRTSNGFVLGLRGILCQDTRSALKLGLEASGWLREWEALLGQYERLLEGTPGGEEEDIGEQFPLFD